MQEGGRKCPNMVQREEGLGVPYEHDVQERRAVCSMPLLRRQQRVDMAAWVLICLGLVDKCCLTHKYWFRSVLVLCHRRISSDIPSQLTRMRYTRTCPLSLIFPCTSSFRRVGSNLLVYHL